MPKFLNLGCGSHASFAPGWTNIDIASSSGVIGHNLYSPLPFEDNVFDAVYHSDVIEHLYKRFAPLFMRECWRVLKSGGVIRVAAPDLEAVVREYLAALDDAMCGDDDGKRRYDWIVVELLDQMTRHRSGGEMLNYWKQNPVPAEDFVIRRTGAESREAIRRLHKAQAQPEADPGQPLPCEMDYEAVGKFRMSGQCHLWMYDRYSMWRLLGGAGFRNVRQCGAGESAIPNWTSYNLDTEADGAVRKPDSFYMEGVK